MFKSRLQETEEKQATLRMSNFGTKCDRKLWYSVNIPEKAETLPPHARLKFLYGDIIEELILSLAEEAGHTVEGRQDTLELEGIVGHRDAIIDGMLVDVKSANSRSFSKFRKRYEDNLDDIWFSTYIDQLQLYLHASQSDERLRMKDVGAFLAVDKEMGHIVLQMVPRAKIDWKVQIERKKRMVEQRTPPPRAFNDEADGMSGNRKLCTYCSYCNFKSECWSGLRTFVASTGPKHLTVVKREPNMLEVK